MIKSNKNINKILKCYFCGDNATSKEHVPPKNLFPKSMRRQLITVPSCNLHNGDFHLIDDRCKIYLQGSSSSKIAFEMFEQKTKSGLMRKESKGFRESLLNEYENSGNQDYLNFNHKHLDNYLEKIIKGLYYYHFQEVLKGELRSFIAKDLNNIKKFQETIYYFSILKKQNILRVGKCHNSNIFYYEYGIKNDFFYVELLFYSDIQVNSIFKKTIIL